MNARVPRTPVRPLWALVIAVSLAMAAGPVLAATLDPAAIGKAAGAKAKQQDDGVVKISWSRTDVPVTVDGMRLAPAAGLGP